MTPLARLRKLCLALPEAEERETWETPTFRVRGKIFCMAFREPPAIWLKAPRGSQEMLMQAAPDRFFRPPYLGHKGWVGMHLAAAPDWAEVGALVRRSFTLVAPRSLAAPEGAPGAKISLAAKAAARSGGFGRA